MNNITTSDLAKFVQARALAVLVRNGGSVSIYGGNRVKANDPAPLLALLCKAMVERCEVNGTVLRLTLAPARVAQDGDPKWFRVAGGDGEGLWDGKVGLKEVLEKDNPDLIVPVDKFVKGSKIEFDLFEHSLIFVEGKET